MILFQFFFLRFGKRRSISDVTTAQNESNASLNSLTHSPESAGSKPQEREPYWLILLLAALIAAPLGWLALRSSEEVGEVRPETRLETGLTTAVPLSEAQVRRAERTIAPPQGWQVIQTDSGRPAFVAPEAEVPVAVPSSTAISSSAIGDAFDGTRRPYVTDVSFDDMEQVGPGRYAWSGVWEGEGYGRVLDRQERLVSPRERGDDIYLDITFDTTVKNPNQPNLFVTIQSNQKRTGQLTNFSAFLNDPETGRTLERKDFGQLPPIYEVTLSRNSGLTDVTTGTLQPLGTLTFADHVTLNELKNQSPIRLQAVNRLFEQRLAEIAELEAAGWVVKEVPPPDYAEPV